MAEKRSKSEGFMLRFPDGMRDRIKAAAETSGRSMNAEIVERLEESFAFAQKEARHQREMVESGEREDKLHHENLELKRQVEVRDQAKIDYLAEIKRLRIEGEESKRQIKELKDAVEASARSLDESREQAAFFRGANSAISHQNHALMKYWIEQPGADKDILEAILHELKSPRPVPPDPLLGEESTE